MISRDSAFASSVASGARDARRVRREILDRPLGAVVGQDHGVDRNVAVPLEEGGGIRSVTSRDAVNEHQVALSRREQRFIPIDDDDVAVGRDQDVPRVDIGVADDGRTGPLARARREPLRHRGEPIDLIPAGSPQLRELAPGRIALGRVESLLDVAQQPDGRRDEILGAQDRGELVVRTEVVDRPNGGAELLPLRR